MNEFTAPVEPDSTQSNTTSTTERTLSVKACTWFPREDADRRAEEERLLASGPEGEDGEPAMAATTEETRLSDIEEPPAAGRAE